MPPSQGSPSHLAAGADEAALLSRLRCGDDAAYAELVRAYGGRMLAVARRFLPEEHDAQDALQDAFLSAFKSLSRFEGGARLSTWLHRIVVNAALMKLRARSRRPESAIEDLLPAFIEDGHQARPALEWRESPSGELEREETCALVRGCIVSLPENYRTVLLLRDIEGLDTAEAARALGLSENAAKIRLHRARQALRALLDPHFHRSAP